MINSITSLRFFCAIYVFLFHMELTIKASPTWLKGFAINGYTGMTFFFILSGFVLSVRYSNDAIDYKKFFTGRMARIYPAYLIAIIISLFVAAPAGYTNFIVYVVTSIPILQAWIPQLWTFGFNGGMWSLSVELFFYALFPFIVVFLRRQPTFILNRIFFACWVLSFFFGVITKALNTPTLFDLNFYILPIYRLPEFIGGMIVGLLFVRNELSVSRNWLGFLFLVYISVTAVFDGFHPINMTLLNAIAFPVVCAVVGYCALNDPKWLKWKPLVHLGEVSYGIYIYQFFVILVLIPRLQAESFGGLSISVIVFLSILAISIFSFRFVESPIRKYVVFKFMANGRRPELAKVS